MRINALRQQRAQTIANASAILDKDGATAEDNARFDAMMAEADVLAGQISRLEQAATIENELALQRGVTAEATGRSVDEVADEAVRERRLMVAYITGRVSNLSDTDRRTLAGRISNAAAEGNQAGGGYTVAPLFQRELLVVQKAFGGMRGVARSITTDTGAILPWPTMDDTSNVATIVGENTAGVPGPDLVFGSVSINAWTYRSGYLPVSMELMQDSAFDFDSLIRDSLALRFARGQNAHFTIGTGTGQPQGIVTASTVGKVGAAGQTASVTYDDLVDLQHSIDPAYRAGAAWMMHDSSIKVLRKLKDAEGRPLWADAFESIAGMQVPGTLLGMPVIVNQDMPVMAAGAKSILFGNFSNYLIRDVLGLRILRLNERFAENFQVAFLGFQRCDGRLISATQPIRAYQNAAA